MACAEIQPKKRTPGTKARRLVNMQRQSRWPFPVRCCNGIMHTICLQQNRIVLRSSGKCPKCGKTKKGPNCCAQGGSWQSICGDGDQKAYTWERGAKACQHVTQEPTEIPGVLFAMPSCTLPVFFFNNINKAIVVCAIELCFGSQENAPNAAKAKEER